MSKHTPGPWAANSDWVLAELPDMMEIAQVSHMRIVPASGGWPEPGTPEADARLIAAAPELLEALRQLLRAYRQAVKLYDPNTDDAFTVAARAVIASATGENA